MDSLKGYPNGEGLAISSTYLNVFFLLAEPLKNLLRIYIPMGGDGSSLPLISMSSSYWLRDFIDFLKDSIDFLKDLIGLLKDCIDFLRDLMDFLKDLIGFL